MIVTKKALPRRTFLRGVGATLALPLLDAMIPALTAASQTAATAARRLGFVYIPMGTHQPLWIPTTEGRITELSPILSSLTPLPQSNNGGIESSAQECLFVWCRPCDRQLHVPERRSREENRRQRLRAGHDRRSDRRQADQHRDSASVTRARHGLQLRRRELRQRLCLCLHEHARLVDADDAASNRSEPSRCLRTHVRRRRNPG